MGKKNLNETGETRVIRARLDHFTIYEVSENELSELEHGTDSDLYLEIGILCLSTSISFFISLWTGTFNDRLYQTFVCVCLITFIAGIVLARLWWKHRKSRNSIIAKIRSRLSDSKINEDGEVSRNKTHK